MNMIRHAVAGLILFAVLSSMFVGVYNGFAESYGFSDTSSMALDSSDEMSVLEHINNLNIIEGLDRTVNGIATLGSPDGLSAAFDATIQAALGIFQFIFGLLTWPFEIASIVTKFYFIPGILIQGLLTILIVYVVFIYYSRNLRGEV